MAFVAKKDPMEELDELLDMDADEISGKLGISREAAECIQDAVADYLGLGDEEGGEGDEGAGEGDKEPE